MGLFSRLKSIFAEQRASVNDDRWFLSALQKSYGTKSGIYVSNDNSDAASTVFACIDILSGTLASLPLMLYQRLGEDGGKKPASNHNVYDLIHTQPNQYQTAYQFIRLMQAQVLKYGFSCAYKEMNGLNEVINLLPLKSNQMQIGMNDQRQIEYTYTIPKNDALGRIQQQIVIPSEYIWQVTDYMTDLVTPKSRITLARESIGLHLAAEQYGGQFFGNSAVTSSVLKHPMKLKEDARTNLKKSLAEFQTTKRFSTMVLEEGMDFQTIGLPNRDSQFLETRTFQVKEIARWFNVPLVLLGEADKSATYASAEQFFLSFAMHTILPWCVNWEQTIAKDLLTPKERKKYFAEFKMEGLMRGDLSSRYNAYKIAREWGWMSANDIRRLENMNPLGKEGDEYLRPMNMTLAGEPIMRPEPANKEGGKNGEDGKEDV